MTVKELRSVLTKLNPDTPVTVHIGDYDERDAVVGTELVKNTYSGKGKILVFSTPCKYPFCQLSSFLLKEVSSLTYCNYI